MGDGPTLTSLPPGQTRSLSNNKIGDEGGKAVREAWKHGSDGLKL